MIRNPHIGSKKKIFWMYEVLVLGGMGLLSRVVGWQTLIYIVLF